MNSSMNANISYCNFIDCCKSDSKNSYIIILDSYVFEFSNNEITFSNKEQSCNIIKSSFLNYHCYANNRFRNIKNLESPIINEISENETIKIAIENYTFDNIDSQIQGRCINVNIVDPSLLKLTNNSILNCPAGNFYLKLEFQNEISSFDIDSFKFINNEISINLHTDFDCCPQILVRNKIIDGEFAILNLNFLNCYFENNKSPDNGGAIQYGKYNQILKTKVSFNNCQFVGNKAANKGGAIAILTYLGGHIENCYFSKNFAENGGNSIYIENEFVCSNCNENIQPEIVINSCLFSENNENNQKSIITANKASNVPIIISDSNFTNSKTNDYIVTFPTNVLSAYIENCTIDSNESEGGGISITSGGRLDIKTVLFKYISIKSALKIISNERDEEINVINCSFDSCSGKDSSLGLYSICFGLELLTTKFSFENNTISQIKINESSHYIGIINCNGNSDIVMRNSLFLNNSCLSLYGGGTGLYIVNSPRFELYNCSFIGNNARQNRKVSRPIDTNDYYNGDGGGIQLGFICESSEYDVVINKCTFEDNHAQRHGGAIALQTQAIVQIIDCRFINNIANFNFDSLSSSSLLFDNYFNLKSEGKGGAIYINPAYKMDNCICNFTGNYMTNIKIVDYYFISNSASDGHAIYIEGDDPGTIFDFKTNLFIDNYNQSQIGFKGAVISSEIILNKDKIINDNTFEYNNPDIKVRPIHYVDHHGIFETEQFTISFVFTKSQVFDFTSISFKSNYFTASFLFTSDCFSESNSFSESKIIDSISIFNTHDSISISNSHNSNSISNTHNSNSISNTHNSNSITLSMCFSLSFVKIRSVSFSYTLVASNSFTMTYDQKDGTYLILETYNDYYNFIPYIIYYYSPTYVATYFQFEIIIKNKITQEQLIGIVCGSTAIFFVVIYAIIAIVKKKTSQNLNLVSTYIYSDSSESKEKDENKGEGNNFELNKIIDEDSQIEYSMDFWL